jgi:hypothetical protein
VDCALKSPECLLAVTLQNFWYDGNLEMASSGDLLVLGPLSDKSFFEPLLNH